MARLEGKVAIVTGGASGIGAATMRRFAREGAAVVCADLDEERGAAIAAEIEAAGGRAAFQATDVAALADLERVVSVALDRFGGLDVMHNNAVWTGGGYVHEIDPEIWDRSMQVALTGVFYGMRAAFLMLARAFHHHHVVGRGLFGETTSVRAVRHGESGGDPPDAHGRG
jgi:NAD(P)-dependent dehydrogenase (short-subunit alcohol dehydrogenase family)